MPISTATITSGAATTSGIFVRLTNRRTPQEKMPNASPW